MARKCIFCQKRQVSREHAWPDWFNKVFPPMESATYNLLTANPPNSTRTWTTGSFNAKVSCVCEACNSGWMSQLEKRVKPILSPMILGERSVDLDLPALTEVAAWAVLRTCLFHELTHANDIPVEHYQYMFKQKKAPPDTIAWIGAYQEPAATAGYANETGMPDGDRHQYPPNAKLYGTTLTAGNLILRVSGHNFGFKAAVASDTFGDSLIPIWPNPVKVKWPPRLALDASGVAALERAFQLGHQSVWGDTGIATPTGRRRLTRGGKNGD